MKKGFNIEDVHGLEVLDSRGNPTVEVTVLSSITARIFCLEVLHQTQRAQKSYQKHWETERCCLVLYPEEKMTPARACK